MISTNSSFSGQSVDSLQHLTAAERECLIYLEETIDSLEVEDDSGLSNDEEREMARHGVAKAGSSAVDRPGEDSERDQKLPVRRGVPTPLLLANGSGNLPLTAPADVRVPETPEGPNHLQVPPLEAHSETPQTPAQMLALATNGDGDRRGPSDTKREPVRSDPRPATDLILIPPPSDFMDEPQPQIGPDPPVLVKMPSKSQGISLEMLRKRAEKRSPVSSDVIHQTVPEMSEGDVPESPSPPDSPMVTLALLPSEAPEPKSPPAVAPKPKKLPSNIIFKSHKSSPDTNLSPSTGDRSLSEGQRIRMEALRKLGLLKDGDADPSLSSPMSRRSWASPPSPLSPAARQTPPSHSTRPRPSPTASAAPLAAPVPSPPMGRVLPQATAALTAPVIPVAQATDILPVPAAFSDAGEPCPVKVVVSEPKVNTGFKSATLEHTGMGSGASASGAELRLAELRNSRTRPASLGSGNDFSNVRVEGAQDANSRRSTRQELPPVSPGPTESQGVPRYHGISVVICPRAEHDEGRREALKKLGLLKD